MATDQESQSDNAPWPQRLLDSIWLLAVVAILYWVLSYIIWGLVDIFSVPVG